eukprot:13816954-Alexandrium_andersonii.AAC.1
MQRGARDGVHFTPTRLLVLLHARQAHAHGLRAVGPVRDPQTQTAAPDRAQRPRAQDESVPVAFAGGEHLETDQRHGRFEPARTARTVRRGRRRELRSQHHGT